MAPTVIAREAMPTAAISRHREHKSDRNVEIAAPPVGRLAMTVFCFFNTGINNSSPMVAFISSVCRDGSELHPCLGAALSLIER